MPTEFEKIANELEADEWHPAAKVVALLALVALTVGGIALGDRVTKLEARQRAFEESVGCSLSDHLEEIDFVHTVSQNRHNKTQRRLAGPDVFPEAYSLEESGEYANRGEPWRDVPRRTQ